MKREKEFHYTNEQMVKDLLAITPIKADESVLDAGSGNNAWFNNLKIPQKFECEIERGCDFHEWNKKVDWIVGNPPFHESWKWVNKSSEVARRGMAFLLNNQCLNSQFTPRRQQRLRDRGFYLQRIHVVSDKRWFGRYYYLIFTKKHNNFISWNTKTY